MAVFRVVATTQGVAAAASNHQFQEQEQTSAARPANPVAPTECANRTVQAVEVPEEVSAASASDSGSRMFMAT